MESISKEDAETGLANQVKEEIERDMLLASSNMQEFLPDYPLDLKYTERVFSIIYKL